MAARSPNNDPYAGLGTEELPATGADPYAGLGAEEPVAAVAVDPYAGLGTEETPADNGAPGIGVTAARRAALGTLPAQTPEERAAGPGLTPEERSAEPALTPEERAAELGRLGLTPEEIVQQMALDARPAPAANPDLVSFLESMKAAPNGREMAALAAEQGLPIAAGAFAIRSGVGLPAAGLATGGAAMLGKVLASQIRGQQPPQPGEVAAAGAIAALTPGVPSGEVMIPQLQAIKSPALAALAKLLPRGVVTGAGGASLNALYQGATNGEIDWKEAAKAGGEMAALGLFLGAADAADTLKTGQAGRETLLQQARDNFDFKGSTWDELRGWARQKMAKQPRPVEPAAPETPPAEPRQLEAPGPGASVLPTSPEVSPTGQTAEGMMLQRMAPATEAAAAPATSITYAPWETEGGQPGTGTQEDSSSEWVAPPTPEVQAILDAGATPTTALNPAQHPIVEFPVDQIAVNKDIRQFKGDADAATGVVEPLGGKYERLGTAPVVLWNKANGETEIITGRHRLDLARRSGEATIPAQVVTEKAGFTLPQALIFDAENNIRDGQGTVKDYALYFRGRSDLDRAAAEQKGLLSRAKGDSGWSLGRDASDGLFSLYANNQIAEAKAVAIARGAPGHAAAQASAIRQARTMAPGELELYARNLSQLTGGTGGGEQLGFGGIDQDFANFEAQAKAIAGVQAARIRENAELIQAAQGAAKHPVAARKMGLPVDDPAALQTRIDQLRSENGGLARPDAATFAALRVAAGLPPAAPAATESEPISPAPENPDQQGLQFQEPPQAYLAAYTRYRALQEKRQTAGLTPTESAELDAVDRTLGQDFFDFYGAQRGGPGGLFDQKELNRRQIRTAAEKRLQAADLETAIDLFGPSPDKAGQLQIFENTANAYLDRRGITQPGSRAALRALLESVWRDRLAAALGEITAGDRRLAEALGERTGARSRGRVVVPGQLELDLSPGERTNAGVGGVLGSYGPIQLQTLRFTNRFVADGYARWIGHRFASAEEWIGALQVLRNPEVEHLWVFPFDATGRMLPPLAMSSHVPASVNLPASYALAVADHLRRLGAVRYRVVHNHPSGNPDPSFADWRTTLVMNDRIRALGGPPMEAHYVIDHGTYSVLDPAKPESYINYKEPEVLRDVAYQPDPILDAPIGPKESMLNRTLPEALGSWAAGIVHGDETVHLLLANVKSQVNATAALAGSWLSGANGERLDEMAERLRVVARKAGAVFAAACYHGTDPAVTAALRALVERGVIRETWLPGEGGQLRPVVSPNFRGWFGEDRSFVAERVAENEAPYNAPADPNAPIAMIDAQGNIVARVDLGGLEHVHPIEMPELVQLSRKLAGSDPLLRNLPKAHGLFRHAGADFRVVLDRRIFANPLYAQRVLAHELGHLDDYLPDLTMGRGNIAGRIGTLRNFLASTFSLAPTGEKPLAAKERQRIAAQVVKDLTASRGPRPDRQADETGWSAWGVERAKVYAATLDREITRRGLSKVAEIRGELIELSGWWRPWDRGNASPHFAAYRDSSAELYADAVSVLYNSPRELLDRAPLFWRGFFAYLDQKPEVKNALFELWDFLHRGQAGVLADRDARLKASFARGDEILLAHAEERELQGKSMRGVLDQWKQRHFDLYAPIIRRARAVRAAGKTLPWADDPEFLFDAHPLAENTNYLFLQSLHRSVVTPLEAAGLTQDDLGLYLFYNRVLNEAYQVGDEAGGRAVLANPLGITPIQARKQLLAMRLHLGPEAVEKLDYSARNFQDLVFGIVERGAEAGIYSPSNLALARANRYNYATFAVLEYLEQSDHIPAAIRQQHGTLSEIASPFTATVIKMMTANKLIEFNRAKRVTIDLLRQHFAGEIQPARETKLALAGGGVVTRFARPPAGKQELMELVDGKPRAWYVEPEIARMFDHVMPAKAHSVVAVLNWTFRTIFYPAFITYNPGFAFYLNVLRDAQRTYIKLPAGVSRPAYFAGQLRAWETTRARLKADVDTTQLARRRVLRQLAQQRPLTPDETDEIENLDRRALAIEMLATRALPSPYDSLLVNPTGRTDYWGELLRQYRLLPEAAKTGWLREKLAPLARFAGVIPYYGQILEALPKTSAYRLLTRDYGWSAHDAAYYVRNHIGTPNFLRRGIWTAMDGTVLPFVNIFQQGFAADLQQARGKIPVGPEAKAQRWSFWRRMTEAVFLPRLLQALAAAGVFGLALKRLYDAVSDYDKTAYLILPLGERRDGDFGYKTVYLRIPQDEMERMVGGVLQNIVQAAVDGHADAAQSLAGITSFAGGQLPNVNPIVSMGAAWSSYLSGTNPIDPFRGQSILTNTQFLAGGWTGTKGMLAWSWRETGGANFAYWDPRSGNTTETVISALPIVNRALKVSDAGLRDKQAEDQRMIEKRGAQIRSAMPTPVARLLQEYTGLSYIRAPLRTPAQQMRLATLDVWYQQVWQPSYELMRMTDDSESWRGTGRMLEEMVKGYEKPVP